MPGLPRPQGTPRTRKTIKIVEVNWRPSWEPEEGLRENEDVARMVDTWNEDNKFNPPARMRHTRETPHKHAATGHTRHRPQQWEHIWHTLRDAIKFNTSETHPVLTSKRWVPAASYETSTSGRHHHIPPPSYEPPHRR
jgi:hypothetical protein